MNVLTLFTFTDIMADIVKSRPLDGLSGYPLWKYQMMLILAMENCDVAVTKEWHVGVEPNVKKQTQKLAFTQNI